MWTEKNGKFIKALRKRHNLTQQQFADMLSISQTPVSRWEIGEREISISMLKRIAALFHMDLIDLISEMENYETDPSPEKSSFKKKIMVVLDSAVELKKTVSMIRNAYPEAEVTGFIDPDTAASSAKQSVFDVIFLDTVISGESGTDLAKRIKKLCPLSHLIFLTGRPEYAVEAWNLHTEGVINGYIMLPLTEERLKKEMHSVFPEKIQ